MDRLGPRPGHVLTADRFIIRCTSSTVSPRSERGRTPPIRRSSASAAESGCARSTSTSRYVPTTSRRAPERLRDRCWSRSSVPRSAQWRSSSTSTRGWMVAALRRKPTSASNSRQRSSSGSPPSGRGSMATRSRTSETMRATSPAPEPSSASAPRRPGQDIRAQGFDKGEIRQGERALLVAMADQRAPPRTAA